MSITKETTIWCDHCGAWEESIENAPILRKQLKHRGWVKFKNQDYCPSCVQRQKYGLIRLLNYERSYKRDI